MMGSRGPARKPAHLLAGKNAKATARARLPEGVTLDAHISAAYCAEGIHDWIEVSGEGGWVCEGCGKRAMSSLPILERDSDSATD